MRKRYQRLSSAGISLGFLHIRAYSKAIPGVRAKINRLTPIFGVYNVFHVVWISYSWCPPATRM